MEATGAAGAAAGMPAAAASTTPRTVADPLPAAVYERLAAGDAGVLDDLVGAYQEIGFWVARQYVHSDDIALDVVQDAFVRVLERHRQYDPARSFRPWFLAIVRNLCIDHIRRPSSHGVAIAEDHRVAGDTCADDLNQREQRERIGSVLESVPANYREYIVWCDVHGMSPQDVAAMTGVDYNTTRWRLHRARTIFRTEWLRRFGEIDA